MKQKKYFTILEAWEDFEQNSVPEIPRPLPAEITNARYSAQGRRGYPALGIERLERILNTYAPGRYVFETGVSLAE